MNTLTITHDIVYSDGSSNPLVVAVTNDGCNVKFLTLEVDVSWEQIAQMEPLAEAFGDMTVRDFSVLANLLSKCYTSRNYLQDLIV